MILYAPELSPKFSEYGINIPLTDDRSTKVYEHLRKRFGENLFSSQTKNLDKADVALVHSPEYVEELFGAGLENAIKRNFDDGKGGSYYVGGVENGPQEYLKNVLAQAGATYQCMQNALAYDFCYYLGGGMHHAMSTHGRGFCLINDIMISIRKLQKTNFITSAWIIDLDAHKGDGTAEIAKNCKNVFTLSIHMAKGWPLDNPNKDAPEFTPSTIDIPIEEGEEKDYIRKLTHALDQMQTLAKGLPDLAVVIGGSDAHEKDALPSSSLLKLSTEQMLQRDMAVYEWLKRKCVAQAYLMGGGYGEDAWRSYANFLERVHGGSSHQSSHQSSHSHKHHGGGGKRHHHRKK